MIELQDSWQFDVRPVSYRLLEEQGRLLLTSSTSSAGVQTKHDAVFKTRSEAVAAIIKHAANGPFVVLTEHDDGRYTLERYS